MDTLHSTYEQNISNGQNNIARLNRRLYALSFIRLLIFALVLVSPFFLYEISIALTVWVALAGISVFLFLVNKYQQISLKRKFEQLKVEINNKELKALQHQFSIFNGGEEFINPHHMNSYDLDLFGQGSLFQFLNRTVTPKGKEQLAQMLQSPLLKKEQIVQRQQLIQELTGDLEWRQNFSTYGQLYGDDKSENELFTQWENQQFKLKTERAFPVLIWAMMLLGIASVLYLIFTGETGVFIINAILQAVFWSIESSNIKIIYSQFGKRSLILQKYEVLLKEIETFKWESAEGKQLHKKLIENGVPSEQAHQLRKIISAFDQRSNMIMGVLLNSVLMWDVWNSYRLIQWHRRNRINYALWIETIAFVDACNSLANLAYNQPEYNYPQFSEGEFMLKSMQMGHPLINPNKRINNNFEMAGTQQTIIITGANMSGKSTFLRTIGVNMVLGMAGAPVCAREMNFKPVEVFSNMRTTDSLFDDESYFFAELKRLQMILEEVDKGRELLIILDEILKGTNSVDKFHGSLKLVERLIQQKTAAIIATHDLKLTDIEQEHPDKVKNQCFEITIDNDEMQFDYTLRNGVTTIMNASFLMKKMGIIK